MARRPWDVQRSGFALAIYLAGFALVCSFIVFDVLDVDGSDMPSRPTAAMTVPVPEALHDIKRASLESPAPLWADLSLACARGSRESEGMPGSAALQRLPPVLPRARRIRAALPRASLADPPASA
jgi:hypothetical protein